MCVLKANIDQSVIPRQLFCSNAIHMSSLYLSVDGGFGLWSAWTTCSQTCGTGTKSRTRSCDSPVPNYNGQNCTGDYSQAISCKITSCPGEKDKSLCVLCAFGGLLLLVHLDKKKR